MLWLVIHTTIFKHFCKHFLILTCNQPISPRTFREVSLLSIKKLAKKLAHKISNEPSMELSKSVLFTLREWGEVAVRSKDFDGAIRNRLINHTEKVARLWIELQGNESSGVLRLSPDKYCLRRSKIFFIPSQQKLFREQKQINKMSEKNKDLNISNLL